MYIYTSNYEVTISSYGQYKTEKNMSDEKRKYLKNRWISTEYFQGKVVFTFKAQQFYIQLFWRDKGLRHNFSRSSPY